MEAYFFTIERLFSRGTSYFIISEGFSTTKEIHFSTTNLHLFFMFTLYLACIKHFSTIINMQKLPLWLNTRQLEALTAKMPTNTTKDALRVMYALALRISELLNLDASHLDFDRGTVTICGKGNKTRTLPITASIWEILKQAEKRPGKLFPYDVRTFRNYVYQAAEKAGIGHVHPHMIRHSRATHLINDGVELHDVKAVMRHASFSSTVIYTHVAVERLRDIMS